MKRTRSFTGFPFSRPLPLLLSVFLVLSCGDGLDDPEGGDAGRESHRSELERNFDPAATGEDLSELTLEGARFALDLFRELGSGENLLLSPISIRIAFAMVYAGAAGETAAEMAGVLRYGTEQSALHDAFNALDLELAARNLPVGPEEEDAVELFLANAFWGRTGYPFRAAYLDRLAIDYGSGIESLDFGNSPEEARNVINRWVEERTADRIRDLLPAGSIGGSTVAVLTNALYFRAPWATPFDRDLTMPGGFSTPGGAEVEVEMMRISDSFGYGEGEGYGVIELPFRGEELSMIFLLPDEGTFDAFLSSLDGDRLDSMVRDLPAEPVEVWIPKFGFESRFALKSLLEEMGMPLPFTAAADFTGIVDGGGIWIDEAYHKTFIAVDEKGVEAAAATAVVMIESAPPPPARVFRADRPFLFLIRDRGTGALLFLGVVTDPTA